MKVLRDKKGFTLVELLATVVILGIIMIVAVPNVMGILTRNRSNTYLEDAKKLSTLAEYQVRSGSNVIQKPATGQCIVMTLSYLDNAEFEDAPNGGEYLKNVSFVVVKKEGNELKYYVQLLENYKNTYRGVKLIGTPKLAENGAVNNYVSNAKKADVESITGLDKDNFLTFAQKFNRSFSCTSVNSVYTR